MPVYFYIVYAYIHAMVAELSIFRQKPYNLQDLKYLIPGIFWKKFAYPYAKPF